MRICTLLLVGDVAGDATRGDPEAEHWQAHLEALLGENEADGPPLLADGSLLVVFDGRDMPTDQATRAAARCALALAAHRPSAPSSSPPARSASPRTPRTPRPWVA